MRQGGVIELDAQVGLLRALLGLAPGGADLGGTRHDAEVRRAIGLLAIVGEDADLGGYGEGSDSAGIAVLDGREAFRSRAWCNPPVVGIHGDDGAR